MKVLTANIALGNPHADRLWPNLRGLTWFHDWRVIPYLVSGGRLGGVFDYSSYVRPGRLGYFEAHSSLGRIIDLLALELPDTLVLNEVLKQVQYESISTALRRLGYGSIACGWSPHHADVTIGTLVASRSRTADAAPLELPWGRQIGGGGGAAYVRLADEPLTIIGCHLVIGRTMRALFEDEIEALTEFALGEQGNGRQVIIAGDFNAEEQEIQDTGSFASLRLKTVTTRRTNPTCLPEMFRTACDHVFLPSNLQANDTRFVPFGSDHLAVVTEAAA